MMEATRESLGFLELDMLLLQTGEIQQKGKVTKSERKTGFEIKVNQPNMSEVFSCNALPSAPKQQWG